MTFSNPTFPPHCDMRRNFADVLRDGPKVEHELLRDYTVEFDWDGHRWSLTVPKGTKAAPSVPEDMMVNDRMPVLGGMWEPSIVHDWTYETRCFDVFTEDNDGQALADELFECLMHAAGVGDVDVFNTKQILLVFGAIKYGRNTFKPGCGPVKIGPALVG